MSIPDEIIKEIEDFSRKKKQDALFKFVSEKLEKGEVSSADVLSYAKKYRWANKPNKTFVIDARIINKLGVVLANLDEGDELPAQFYKLAAERDSSWGNTNYARLLFSGRRGVEKSIEDALIYVQKGIELEEEDKKAGHKLTLFKVLDASERYVDANVALLEYLRFEVLKYYKAKGSDKASAQKKVDAAIDWLSDVLDELEKVLKSGQAEVVLERLEPIFKCSASWPALSKLVDRAYYIQGRCYKAQGKFSKAWRAFCRITDKCLTFYADVVAERVSLLKEEVRRQLSNENDQADAQEVVRSLMLPGNIPMPVTFHDRWMREAAWFDSVKQDDLTKFYKKRCEQIQKLIQAKQIEVSLLKEALEEKELEEELEEKDLEGEECNALIQKRETLEDDIESLESAKEELDEIYQNHRPQKRSVFRRHVAESRFFQPDRSNKHEALIALVEKIIDQRFKLPGSEVKPIVLSDVSGRLLITAERVFQEVVVSLSGNDDLVLGIPVAREKPWRTSWSSGVTKYGPCEHYHVGETEIDAEHRVSPKRQRLGDSFMPQHGSYTRDIYPFLRELGGQEKEKEKKISALMIRYNKAHQSVSLEELKEISEDATEEDVHQFNRICFLVMTKEQSQWHSATKRSFQLGMTVSFARCLILIEAGFISFQDVFRNTVLFSIYSHTGLADSCSEVAASAGYIDKMYMAYLQQQNGEDHVSFFRKHVKDKSMPVTVLTREQAHRNMQYVYGGENETDGEGYESDLSMSAAAN